MAVARSLYWGTFCGVETSHRGYGEGVEALEEEDDGDGGAVDAGRVCAVAVLFRLVSALPSCIVSVLER